MRVKFPDGKQREFIELIVKKTNSPSLRGLRQFGFDIPYSTLKNYSNEKRSLPKEFFIGLCEIAKVSPNDFSFEYLDENWGKSKGGKSRQSKDKFKYMIH